MSTPITPDAVRQSLTIPSALIALINEQIQKNVRPDSRLSKETSLQNGELSGVEKLTSQIDLDACVRAINKGVPYESQLRVTPLVLDQIKGLYQSFGWDVTASYDQIGRNEYANHLLFVELNPYIFRGTLRCATKTNPTNELNNGP